MSPISTENDLAAGHCRRVCGVLAFDFDDTLVTNNPDKTLMALCRELEEKDRQKALKGQDYEEEEEEYEDFIDSLPWKDSLEEDDEDLEDMNFSYLKRRQKYLAAKNQSFQKSYQFTTLKESSRTQLSAVCQQQQQQQPPLKKVPNPSDYKDIVLFQRDVFRYMHEHGITMAQILQRAVDCKIVTEGIKELLEFAASDPNLRVVIISDNNSTVLEHVLNHFRIRGLIDSIATNPSKVNQRTGRLEVDQFRIQTHCDLSFQNLCKGDALEEYAEKVKVELNVGENDDFFIAYAGDNSNDICPALRLKNSDLLFPRRGYPLDPLLTTQYLKQIKAPTFLWRTGRDILDAVRERIARGVPQ